MSDQSRLSLRVDQYPSSIYQSPSVLHVSPLSTVLTQYDNLKVLRSLPKTFFTLVACQTWILRREVPNGLFIHCCLLAVTYPSAACLQLGFTTGRHVRGFPGLNRMVSSYDIRKTCVYTCMLECS